MKRFKHFLLGLALSTLCIPAFAQEQAQNQTETKTEVQQQYNFVDELMGSMPAELFVEEISAKEMDERLHELKPNNFLYIKYTKNDVLVMKDLANDRASCRQILYLAPNEEMLEFFTNDKKTFQQMFTTIRPHTREGNLIGGYQLVADKSPEIKLDDNNSLYRIWVKKTKPTNRAIRVLNDSITCYPTVYWPISIGIGWGFRHHRHYVHPGPRFHGPRPHGPRPHHR